MSFKRKPKSVYSNPCHPVWNFRTIGSAPIFQMLEGDNGLINNQTKILKSKFDLNSY